MDLLMLPFILTPYFCVATAAVFSFIRGEIRSTMTQNDAETDRMNGWGILQRRERLVL